MRDSTFSEIVAAALCLSALMTVQAQDLPVWAWTPTSRMSQARYDSCAVSLADGRVLIAGGTGSEGDLSSVELYGTDGAFTAAASLGKGRSGHACALLADGRVLASGGDPDGQATAEVYDPAADQWTFLPDPGPVRRGHSATLLFDGRVLLAGGATAILEVFDPAQNTISMLDVALSAPREGHRAVALDDGRVLIVGGSKSGTVLGSSEIFSPSTNGIDAGPDLALARQGHSATRLIDGRVLIAGGSDGSGELGNAELYLPDENRFEWAAAPMQTARTSHLAILVEGNGSVVLAGGSSGGSAIGDSEVFQPWDNTFVRTGPLTAPRKQLVGASLPDGSLLAAGGLNDDGPNAGCGVITPPLSFTQSVYFDGQTATARISLSKPSVKTVVDLSLFQQNGTGLLPIQDRLLNTTASNLSGSFSPVPVMVTAPLDNSQTFVLKSATLGASASFVSKGTTEIIITHKGTQIIAGLPFRIGVRVNASNAAHALSGSWAFSSQTGPLTATPSGLPNMLPLASGSDFAEVELCCAPATAGTVVNIQGTYAGSPFYNSSHGFMDQSYTVVNGVATLNGVGSNLGLQLLTPSEGSVFVLPPFTSEIYTPPPVPTGIVTVSKSGTTIGAFPVMQGTATFPYTPPLAEAGQNVCFNAQYSGDAVYRMVAASVCRHVEAAASTLTISSPSSTYTFGVPVQVNATVTFPSGLGPIGGTVRLGQRRNVPTGNGDFFTTSFFPFGAGDTITLTPGTGQASGTTSLQLPFTITNIDVVGGSGFTAEYNSPSLLLGFSFATLALPRNKVNTQITLDALLAQPLTASAPLTLRATINYPTGIPLPPGVGPGGTVDFLDNGVIIGSIRIPGLSSTAPPNQPIVISLSNISLTAGKHGFQVKYRGDDNFTTSQFPLPIVGIP